MARVRAPTPNNLPANLTTFVGREREIAEVIRLLAAARLVTLTGTGGCGKSRLAMEVARSLHARLSSGAKLRRLLDRVGKPRGGPNREGRLGAGSAGLKSREGGRGT